MTIEILEAYDRVEELRPLYEEYAAMLVEAVPIFKNSLARQNYDVELSHLHDKYGKPGGRIYVLHVDGQTAGCIGLRRIDNEYCEMKRLYVRPNYRGAKLGERLVGQILADARAEGYRFMRLDTLPPLKSAIRMYRSLGFYDIEKYYDCVVPDTIYLEKAL